MLAHLIAYLALWANHAPVLHAPGCAAVHAACPRAALP
jgi:hypothetical protein